MTTKNKYQVRYYKRHPLAPQARWEIHRETVYAANEQEAAETMAECDAEIIDVTDLDLREEMELAARIASDNAEALDSFIHNLARCITNPLDVLHKQYNESTASLSVGEQTELAYGQGDLTKGNDHA